MTGSAARGIRWAIKRTQPFKELIEQRDALILQREELISHRDTLIAERDFANEHRFRLEAEARNLQIEAIYGEVPFVPNGHFYSPIASQQELDRDASRIFREWPRSLPDIDLREEAQLEMLLEFSRHYASLPFRDEHVDGLRYRYNNDAFGYSDAIFLNGMIRHARPKRVVEVGSGNSSCMLLDTNERWFDNSIKCTFIEPYPQLLESLLKPGDRERITIHPDRVQDVDTSVFTALEANDILFVDSTHVSKIGSDVNHIFFEVLPALAPGVFVHFHDIFYPFEYPRAWAKEGRGWNEAYMLRAFLQNNEAFEIVVFNTFLAHFHREYFAEHMPLCLKNPGGSIWLRKRT